jgi:predicted chitinase
MLDEKKLFAGIRKIFGKLSQKQVDSVNAILDAMASYPKTIKKADLAYIIATAYHESRLTPVREGFAKTDKAARRIVRKRPYGAQVNGHVYYGRGFVQLTWRSNYVKMEQVLGVPLDDNPDLALEPETAAKILVYGMMDGLFTGKKLHDYKSFYHMRRVVNGLDKAGLIAGYAKKLLPYITAEKELPPITVPLPPVETRVEVYIDGKKMVFFPEQKQEVQTMAKTTLKGKPAYKSKTVGGALIMIMTVAMPPILTKLGFAEWAEAIKNHDWLALIQLASAALVVYGRDRAKEALRWPKISW